MTWIVVTHTVDLDQTSTGHDIGGPPSTRHVDQCVGGAVQDQKRNANSGQSVRTTLVPPSGSILASHTFGSTGPIEEPAGEIGLNVPFDVSRAAPHPLTGQMGVDGGVAVGRSRGEEQLTRF